VFAIDSLNVTTLAGSGGTIDASSKVACGSNKTVNFAPAPCYQVDSVYINNVYIGKSSTYIFNNITGDSNIRVVFAIDSLNIITSAGTGGTIDPSSKVACNGSKTVNFIPDFGYKVDELLINNVNVPDSIAGGRYTFINVTGDSSIKITFKPILKPDAKGIVYVDLLKTGDGSSWSNAYPELATPLLFAAKQKSGAVPTGVNDTIKTIYVAQGTYYPMYNAGGYDFASKNFPSANGNRDNSFVLVKGIQIIGGFVPTSLTVNPVPNFGTSGRDGITILSGKITHADSVYHVLIGAGNIDNSTLLDGFTITEGNANGSGNITVNGVTISRIWGGGICNLNSSPMFTNIVISGNSATWGGGMYNSDKSSPTLFNATISGNRGNSGGGIHNLDKSSPTLINVTISGNIANNGGGMSNLDNSSPMLVNVTISGNKANMGGGILNDNNSSPMVHNTIIWGNTATSGNNVDNYSSVPKYSYSLIEGSSGGWGSFGTDLGNNIDTDPLFIVPVAASFAPTTAGNYMLQSCSQAINAGDTVVYKTIRGIFNFTGETDMDGSKRLIGTNIDVGAYEFQNVLFDTVYFAPLLFTYSGSEQAPTLTTRSGCTIPDNVLYKVKGTSDITYTTTKPVNADNYTLKIFLQSNGAYAALTDTADFVIQPKDITVKANGGSSEYGDNPANPGLTATGLVNGETESVLTGLSNSFGIDNTTPMGIYELQVVGTPTNLNYNITSYDTGIWIVHERQLTIKAKEETIYYGQIPVLEYDILSGSLLNGDTLSGKLHVDNYNIGKHLIEKGTLTAGNNYQITFISDTLTVLDADTNASIETVFVDDKKAEQAGNQFFALSECGANQAEITIVCHPSNTVMIDGVVGNTCIVSLPKYGENNFSITITSPNGKTQTYTLTINRQIPFDQVVIMRWNNTLTVIKNSANNGGFTFTSFKWYRNDKEISTDQSWSMNSNGEWLNPDDEFYVELTAEGYSEVLRTCKSKIVLRDIPKFYPNPVAKGQVLHIETKMNTEGAVIEIFSMDGVLVETIRTLSLPLQIPISNKYATGVYLFVLKGKDGAIEEMKVVVH